MTLGDRIRRAREHKGYSQKDAAEILGINNVNLNRYERNVNEPGVSMLNRIARLYGITVDYITGNTEGR